LFLLDKQLEFFRLHWCCSKEKKSHGASEVGNRLRSQDMRAAYPLIQPLDPNKILNGDKNKAKRRRGGKLFIACQTEKFSVMKELTCEFKLNISFAAWMTNY